MRVAFVDHSFHQKTRSSRFFLDLIAPLGTIDVILDHSWDKSAAGTTPEPEPAFDPDAYDIIIIYQAHEFFARLDKPHPNVVFVPMYDAMIWGGEFFWRPAFDRARVISFSWKLHEEVLRRRLLSSHVQYFPDPGDTPPVTGHDALRAFFWYRTAAIGPSTVFTLCGSQPFETLTIHNAPDPNHQGLGSWQAPASIGRLELSGWFESEKDYFERLRHHTVFFAPRGLEGIGMSFLEAMALGQCVVAPNAPTMNEYIANGTNGLLYPPERPLALDFSRAAEMGARARDSVERGFARWQADRSRLLDFITAPRTSLTRTAHGWTPPLSAPQQPAVRPAAPQPAPPQERPAPLVSVVTVCLNAAQDLDATIRSVLDQSGGSFEYLILDGGSTDGSLGIIQRHAHRLAYWHSRPDAGIYPAMAQAAARARGDFVLFMNAGDRLADATALERMFARAPQDADVVYGHHLYRQEDGSDEYRPAVDFEVSWQRLQAGRLGYDWLAGLPAHQATAVRRTLLERLGFDPRYRLAADLDLLLRARGRQARFFHCDELIAVYQRGGRSHRDFRRCREEWTEIARTHGEPIAAARFGREMALHASLPVRLARTLLRAPQEALKHRHPVLAARLRRLLAGRLFRLLVRKLLKLAAAGR